MTWCPIPSHPMAFHPISFQADCPHEPFRPSQEAVSPGAKPRGILGALPVPQPCSHCVLHGVFEHGHLQSWKYALDSKKIAFCFLLAYCPLHVMDGGDTSGDVSSIDWAQRRSSCVFTGNSRAFGAATAGPLAVQG